MPKTIVITGSSSGIGKATAIQFANEGWNVVATMRSPEKEKDLLAYSNIKLFTLDVSDKKSVDKAIKEIIEEYKVIDVIVNNAGFGVDGVFEEIDDKTIEEQFNTNVFGLMRVTSAVIPYMRERKKGTIIQISSMGGKITFPLYSIYHSTKWAVEGFSESLQFELNQFNIKIKIIEPGKIKTEFYGKSRKKIESHILDYQRFIDKCEKASHNPNNSGVNPKVVAKTIYMAAIEESNRLRIAVGYPSPQLLFFRKLLPESWFLRAIRIVLRI